MKRTRTLFLTTALSLFGARLALAQGLPIQVGGVAPPLVGSDPTAPGPLTRVPDDTPADEGAAPGGTARFEHHAYLRAPLLIGVGPRAMGGGNDLTYPARVPDLEANPDVPGATRYVGDWRNTGNVGYPWTQMNLRYGDDTVGGVIGFSATDFVGMRQEDVRGAQVGVYAAFVNLRQKNLFKSKVDLDWNVGLVPRAYGTSGKYDSGRYFTYLFGAIGATGEVLGLERKFGQLQLRIEHGIGVRDAPLDAAWATTLVHHAHAGLRYGGLVTVAAHYIQAWTHDEQRRPDAGLKIWGAEARLNAAGTGVTGAIGDLYVGFSQVEATDDQRLAPAVYVIDAYGGAGLNRNYFLPAGGAVESAATSGKVQTVLFQYDYDLRAAINGLRGTSTTGPNLLGGVFGMYNRVQAAGGDYSKLKYGAELAGVPLAWLAIALRYDHVSPYSYDESRAFSVITPKLVLRTRWFGAHEEILLAYSHYSYGSNVKPYFDPIFPDAQMIPAFVEHAVTLQASMWW